MTRDRIGELDVLKGVSILGVLVIHSSFDGRFNQETLFVQATLARLFDWSVLGFFFCSGCLHNPAATLAVTFKKRAVSLLVPLCLYNLIYNFIFVAMGTMGWVPKPAIGSNFHLLYTAPFQSPAFQLYFLPYLFLVSMVVCGTDWLLNRFRRRGYVLILVVIFLFYLKQGYPGSSHGAEYLKLPVYFAAFVIGVICAPFIERQKFQSWLILAALALIVFLLFALKKPVVSVFVPPLMVALIRSFSLLREMKGLFFLGGMSGSIYLWHTPLVLPVTTKLLAHLGMPSMLNFLISLVLTLGFCILLRFGLDACCKRIWQRPAPRWIVL